jgi:hypothetical protein
LTSFSKKHAREEKPCFAGFNEGIVFDEQEPEVAGFFSR